MEEQWEKCNAFMLAWIMNMVSNELLSSIIYATDAAMVWADLKERFDKVYGSRGYQFHREICMINQGNMSISTYFSKLRLLWDEFDALVPLPSCNCDKSRSYIDHLAYLRLFAFLMGLTEVYAHVRSQILMMSSLPSVSKAYTVIMADEGQRLTANSHMGSNAPEQIAMFVGKGNFPRKFQSRKKNCDLIYDFCKILGYTREECYKLNGYPPDWKFKKRLGASPNQLIQNSTKYDVVNHVGDTRIETELGLVAPAAPILKGKATEVALTMVTQPLLLPVNIAGSYIC